MKNLILLSAVFFISILYCSKINATVHRVNNTGADADFTDAQSAHNGASSGDTLYFESSPTNYGLISISKEIHIIGNGYFLGENIDLQANIAPATLTTLTLLSGSDNSTIQGMTISTILCGTTSTFEDIIIERNYITYGIYLNSSQDLLNIYFLRNYILGSHPTYTSFKTIGAGIKSFVLSNNVFHYINIYSSINLGANSTATFKNNIFNLYTITSNFCTYKNNIVNISVGALNEAINTVVYNTCVGTDCSSDNNNTNNAVWNSLFVGIPNQAAYSTDSRFELSGSSDAAGAGEAGIDCGIFDGEAVYKLSGIPAIPTIYKLVAPSIVNGNFNITISTRSNN